jgi:hypothetical protein
MNRVTVQYCIGGQYGEFVAKSDVLDCQAMVDEMWKTAKPGIEFRFLGESGVMVPSEYDGEVDARMYLPAKRC